MNNTTDIADRIREAAEECANELHVRQAAFRKALDEYKRLRAELEDALDVENGAGPTALGMVVAERDALQAELETERIRLAACGVVALANTPDSAAKARDMQPEYRSASCDDVARMVDENMRLRAELDTARADAWQAMAYLSHVRKIVGGDDFLDMIERVNRLRVELDALKAALPSVPEKLPVDGDYSKEDFYKTGWNDCVDEMTAPKPGGEGR